LNLGEIEMDARFKQLVNAAKILFATKGYGEVGIREICEAAGCSPVQAYRLGLSKIDLLAEVSIALTDNQIQVISQHNKIKDSEDMDAFIIRYLTLLYESDIENIKIRRETAAYGWMWSAKYEERIVQQVFALLSPIVQVFESNSFDRIEARCLGIWSLYYVGFRGAAVHQQTANQCINSIANTIKILSSK
jgi:AcrR family transcriptional regulator